MTTSAPPPTLQRWPPAPALAPAKADLLSEGSWTTDDGTTASSHHRTRKLQWRDGSVYVGEVDDQYRPHGQGHLSRPDLEYEGEWAHGEAAGLGILRTHQGIYEGNWQQDAISGFGKLVFADGAVYEGQWLNDRPEGYGVFINPAGVMFRGQWRDGVYQPDLSGYDARGIQTCVQEGRYDRLTGVQRAVSTVGAAVGVKENMLAAAADLGESISRIQPKRTPGGDAHAFTEMPHPMVAMCRGQYDEETHNYQHQSEVFDSPVYPDDPSKSGRRVQSGYWYKTNYHTDVWGRQLSQQEEIVQKVPQPSSNQESVVKVHRASSAGPHVIHCQVQSCEIYPSEPQPVAAAATADYQVESCAADETPPTSNAIESCLGESCPDECPIEKCADEEGPEDEEVPWAALKPTTGTCYTCPEPDAFEEIVVPTEASTAATRNCGLHYHHQAYPADTSPIVTRVVEHTYNTSPREGNGRSTVTTIERHIHHYHPPQQVECSCQSVPQKKISYEKDSAKGGQPMDDQANGRYYPTERIVEHHEHQYAPVERIVEHHHAPTVERVVEHHHAPTVERVVEHHHAPTVERVVEHHHAPSVERIVEHYHAPTVIEHRQPVMEHVVEHHSNVEHHHPLILEDPPVERRYPGGMVVEHHYSEVEERPSEVSRIVPVPVENVRTVEFKLPKLKIKTVKVDYPVYAPRFVECPVAADTLSREALELCQTIQNSVDLLTEPQSAADLESIAETIVENLKHMKPLL